MFGPLEDPPTPPPVPTPGHGVEIVKAVVIATLSALSAGLVNWWLEDLKETRRKNREDLKELRRRRRGEPPKPGDGT